MHPATIRTLATLPVAGMAFDTTLRARNAMLDAMTYGVCRLTPAERAMLARDAGAACLTVHPRGAHGERGVVRHADHAALLVADGPVARQIAVGGLGGSELGAASLARALADVTGRAVIAVPAGYDRDDLVAEAMGGLFLFSAAARARHAAGTLRRGFAERLAGGPRLAPELFAAPAVATLLRLMTDPERRLDVVLAHSRGGLALSAAYARLSRLAERRPFLRAAQAQVITVGCVTAFPPGVAWTRQALGTLDALGHANSRTDLDHERIPGASHHVNPSLPLGLDLAAYLGRVLHG
ncbi:MAG: hypothetical protein ACFBWO_01540 [Paracoccaceae bacterium]